MQGVAECIRPRRRMYRVKGVGFTVCGSGILSLGFRFFFQGCTAKVAPLQGAWNIALK